jgi:hypothetical protein
MKLKSDATDLIRVFLCLKIINMKAKFYYIPDLKLVINLEHLSSLQLSKPIQNETIPFRCCLVVGKSIFWCDELNYYTLKFLLL